MLKPGGRLYFADTHPMIQPLEEVGGQLVPTFGYRTPTGLPLAFTVNQTYTGDTRQFLNTENFEWIHPLSDILMALIESGLAIERVAEHDALPWQMFPMMVKGGDRMWRLPAGHPRLPLSISIGAVKTLRRARRSLLSPPPPRSPPCRRRKGRNDGRSRG